MFWQKEKKVGPTEIVIGEKAIMPLSEISEKILAAKVEEIDKFRSGGLNTLFFRGLLVSDRDAERFFQQAEEKYPAAWEEARDRERDTRASTERAIEAAIEITREYLSVRDQSIIIEQAANRLGIPEGSVPIHDDRNHMIPESLMKSLWELVHTQVPEEP